MVTGYEDYDGVTWYKLEQYQLEAGSMHAGNSLNTGIWKPSGQHSQSLGTITAEKKYPVI